MARPRRSSGLSRNRFPHRGYRIASDCSSEASDAKQDSCAEYRQADPSCSVSCLVSAGLSSVFRPVRRVAIMLVQVQLVFPASG